MFTLDWNDPQTFWLNVTNVVLALVTLICFAVVAYAAAKEVLVRVRRWMPILSREPHVAHMPELGYTMADGGEPIAREQKPRPNRFRKSS